MSKPVRSRRLIALFAAYVVALQGFLLPLTVAAFAAPETVLCTAAGEASRQPAGGDTGCGCAAGCGTQCCTPSLSAPPAQAELVLDFTGATPVTPSLAILAAPRAPDHNPHSPRAPPFV
jgi:hypothetical protein